MHRKDEKKHPFYVSVCAQAREVKKEQSANESDIIHTESLHQHIIQFSPYYAQRIIQ